MKTLIINGSPHIDGDTVKLINRLKERLCGDVEVLSAYRAKISPCVDCRRCWQSLGCVINDDMQTIYSDDFDNVVIASPIYISGLPGPMVSLASRLQAYYAAKRFLKSEMQLRPKRAALMLVGGGDGKPLEAIHLSEWIAKELNAIGLREHMALSLHTDEVSAETDSAAIAATDAIADWLNGTGEVVL